MKVIDIACFVKEYDEFNRIYEIECFIYDVLPQLNQNSRWYWIKAFSEYEALKEAREKYINEVVNKTRIDFE